MKRTLMTVALLAAFPFAANASDLNYSYIDAGFARVNLDVEDFGDENFDGFAVRGSANLGATNLHLFGGYRSMNAEEFGFDVDLNEIQIGFGHHMAISDTTDLVTELSYLNSEADEADLGDIDGDDYRLSFGLRSKLASNFEGLAKLNYTDGDVYEEEFSLTVGGLLRLSPTWGLVAEVEVGNTILEAEGLPVDTTSYLVGVRATF